MIKVLKFSAVWCGPCKTLEPKFKEISEKPEFKGVEFQYINIDENQDLSRKHNIRSIPTVIILKDDVEVDRIVGMAPAKIESSLSKIVNGVS